MRLTDIFKFKLFDRTDKADLDVVNENFQNVETALNNCKQDLSNHKSSGDHDSRYYTEAEMDGKLSGKSDTTHNHDSRYLHKSAVINSNTVTEAGYALDARQANPNVSGSLGAQINSLNRTFTTQINDLNTNLSNKILKIEKTYTNPQIQIGANNYNAYTYSDFKDIKPGYILLSTNVEVDKDLVFTAFHYLNDSNLRVSFFNAYGAEQIVGITVIRQIWLKNS